MTAKELLDGLNDPNTKPLYIEGEDWDNIYAGNVTFVLSNGWKLIVFNDCNDWDYIDSIITNIHPNGNKRLHHLWDCVEFEGLEELRNWRPINIEEWINCESHE